VFELFGEPVSWAELAGFVTGIACVALAVMQRIETFAVGIANNVFFVVLFTDARLYADAALQVVYIALGVMGWWVWATRAREPADVRRASTQLTTSMSLGAQLLLNLKRLETWYVWIAVDIIYVPLYLSRDLNLTALVYVVFLALCIQGWRQWRVTV
jgi:nicotinamide mononucleotide transporter